MPSITSASSDTSRSRRCRPRRAGTRRRLGTTLVVPAARAADRARRQARGGLLCAHLVDDVVDDAAARAGPLRAAALDAWQREAKPGLRSSLGVRAGDEVGIDAGGRLDVREPPDSAFTPTSSAPSTHGALGQALACPSPSGADPPAASPSARPTATTCRSACSQRSRAACRSPGPGFRATRSQAASPR
jgi:hypothetical protein